MERTGLSLRWGGALDRSVPGLPASDVLGLDRIEIPHEAGEGVLARFHGGGGEAEGEYELAIRRAQIHFAGDGDVSVLGALVGADQPLVRVQLAPSVGDADEADGAGEAPRRTGQRQRTALPLG